MIRQQRPIRDEEAAVIIAALKAAPTAADVERFASAVPSLRVVGRCECGCASVDFEVGGDPRESYRLADGIGTTRSGGQVGVLVWACGDRLSGLEIYDLGAGDDDLNLPDPGTLAPFPTDGGRAKVAGARPHLRWLIIALATGLLAPIVGHLMGPFDPSGTRYGANWPGDWRFVLSSLAVHSAVLSLIVPWWGGTRLPRARYAVLALLFVLAGILELTVSQHAGRLVAWHQLWVIGVGVAAGRTAVRFRPSRVGRLRPN